LTQADESEGLDRLPPTISPQKGGRPRKQGKNQYGDLTPEKRTVYLGVTSGPFKGHGTSVMQRRMSVLAVIK